MERTIAQQLGITEFPFKIKDSNGNKIYYENSDGFWYKKEYDSNGNEIYYENSNRDWCKNEYDSNGNRIYYEDSNGDIRDSRPKVVEMTMEEICKALGKNIKIIKQ